MSNPSITTSSGTDNAMDDAIHEMFQRDGFVGPLTVLSKPEAKLALEEVTNELAKPNSNRFKLHLVLPSLAKIAHHPKLVQAVQQVLQTSNILLWSSDVNAKPPNSDGYFAPHQDSTYAGLIPPSKCLTAWVALSDPVGPKQGCLSFYPSSHKLGQLPHETSPPKPNSNDDGNFNNDHNKNDNNMLSLGQYISSNCLKDNDLSISDVKQVSLECGQVTLHSFCSVHFSGPNTTDTPRVGFALRYIAGNDIVKQTKPIKEMVTYISGNEDAAGDDVSNNNHHYDIEPKLSLPEPTPEEIQMGYKAREEAMKREEANYFSGTTSSSGNNNNQKCYK